MARIGAGRMRESVEFDAPVEIPDGSGGTDSGWSDPAVTVKCRARFTFLRGGETIIAARLAGRQPILVTIRATKETWQIRGAWRMRDKHGVEYAIQADPVPHDDRQFLDIMVESGVPT